MFQTEWSCCFSLSVSLPHHHLERNRPQRFQFPLSLPFRLTSNEAVAGQLLAAERYHLGLDFLDTYRKKVAAVTPADVLAAAKKHLHPNRLVLVAVGPITEDGKPLDAPKK